MRTEYNMLALKYKDLMSDIINVAFRNNEKFDEFKHFYLKISDAVSPTMLGKYEPDKKTITIYDLDTETADDVMITILHELSHHIEHCIYDKSGHQKSFYDIHIKLLFAAFDMGILNIKDVTESQSRAQNGAKLARLMINYKPNPINYKGSIKRICCYNSYNIKDELKERKYWWNAVDKCWCKEIIESDLITEIMYLKGCGIGEGNIKSYDAKKIYPKYTKLNIK